MVKKIILSILGFIALQANAQLLKPIGPGLPSTGSVTDEVIATTTDSNFTYAATRHKNGTGSGYTIIINKWNGFFWQQLPGITFDTTSVVKTIAVYLKQVYIGGNFTIKSPSITNTKTLVHFSNILNRWVADTGLSFLNGGFGVINSMAVYKNLLYIAGYFSTIANGDSTRHIVSYNGNTGIFNRCGGYSYLTSGTNGQINSLYVFNDTLYAGGTFSSAGQVSSYNISAYDGAGSWRSMIFTTTGIAKLTSYQNNLALVTGDNKSVYLKTGNTTFLSISTNMGTTPFITDIEEFNNELWASGSFYGGSASIIKFSGSLWSSTGLPLVSVYELFKYKNGLYLVSSNEVAGNIRINKLAQIVFSQTRLSGHVYQDVNHNCKYDNSLDKPFAGKTIYFIGLDNFNVITDNDGYYSVTVPAGSYSVSLVKFKNWEIDSPCTKNTYTLSATVNSIYDSLDFSLRPIATGADLRVHITPNGGYLSQRDMTQEYTVTYNNNGTQDLSSAAIEVDIDKRLTNFSSTASYIANGPKFTFSFANLKAGEQRSFMFTAKAKTDSFNVTDKLNFIASSSVLSDLDYTDNADTLVQQITQTTQSPVQKDVYPLPSQDSFSLVSATNTEINYIIHFENTSTTDTVHTVIVIDTIDVNSSIQYLEETGASHPYTVKGYSCPPAMGKGVIVWTFSNINLPPYENNDNVANRGHVGFKIKFNGSVPLGTIIKNAAHVVFDYYDPMKTNNTYAKVADIIGINSKIFKFNNERICANPVSGQIILLNTYDSKSSYKLINAAGATVIQGVINSKTIDVKGLATGIYFFMIEEKNSLMSQKILIN